MTQFSLFGAAAAEPVLDDLDGVLLAGGHWVRHGRQARLSVVVADRWRAEALAAEFAARGLAGTGSSAGRDADAETGADAGRDTDAGTGAGRDADADAGPGAEAIVPAEGGFGVRTAFDERLEPCAARWSRGANQGPPAGFALTAAGLRLWALAAGRADPAGYLLATSRPDDVVHGAAGAQLSRLGVAAVSLSARGGPGWRVTSAKRIRRLAELLGPAPDGGAGDWPRPA